MLKQLKKYLKTEKKRWRRTLRVLSLRLQESRAIYAISTDVDNFVDCFIREAKINPTIIKVDSIDYIMSDKRLNTRDQKIYRLSHNKKSIWVSNYPYAFGAVEGLMPRQLTRERLLKLLTDMPIFYTDKSSGLQGLTMIIVKPDKNHNSSSLYLA